MPKDSMVAFTELKKALNGKFFHFSADLCRRLKLWYSLSDECRSEFCPDMVKTYMKSDDSADTAITIYCRIVILPNSIAEAKIRYVVHKTGNWYETSVYYSYTLDRLIESV